ncbi:hypothetical protein [Streptomyces sp. NPDC018055]|uniref:hypothetical protein n=1 Tax=Streptomyces sp. NPDC018055 TaxID=3365038 RepID=UPI003789BDFC
MAETHDQTYIAILGAALAQHNINALILAENGNNQLGRPHPNHPGWRIWNGNLCRIGHHNPHTFALEADAILPGRYYADRAHHWHAHLVAGTWTTCAPHDDGAIPLTIAITQTRDD